MNVTSNSFMVRLENARLFSCSNQLNFYPISLRSINFGLTLPRLRVVENNTACGKTYMYSLYHPTEMFLAAFIMQTMNISQKVNTRCVGKESASKPKK